MLDHRRPDKGRRRFETAIDAHQLVIFEKHGQLSLLNQSSFLFQAIHIIPAVIVERVADHRRTQGKTHLRPRHAWLQLIDHFLGNNVALLDFYFIEQRWNRRTSGEQYRNDQRE